MICQRHDAQINMKTQSRNVVVREARQADRDAIYHLRHEVYARELRQHPCNAQQRLTDTLDAYNHYIVITVGGRLAGCISITPPNPNPGVKTDPGANNNPGINNPTAKSESALSPTPHYSIEKYFERDDLPFVFDDGLYEVRLLTVAKEYRSTRIAGVLMYAAMRWIEARGGRQMIGIGRRQVMKLYQKVGFKDLNMWTRSGAVEYGLMQASIADMMRRGNAKAPRWRRSIAAGNTSETDHFEWRMDLPLENETGCYHGGAFFEAIGDGFENLDRRASIINADVLDAWFDPAPGVIKALEEHLPWLLKTSPPTGGEGLIRKIAETRGVERECLLVGGGSSDLIYQTLTRWLSKNSRVLILDPMYGEYAHVLEGVIGCTVDRLRLNRAEHYRVDIKRLEARLRRGYDLVVLVNPNSPTGKHVGRPQMEALIDGASGKTRFWIDETYIEYAGAGQSLERFATTSANTVVCKSMSKVYALSGARAAYLCGARGLIEPLQKYSPPWAVSLPGQVAAVAALDDPDYYAGCYRHTHRLRDDLAESLRQRCSLEVEDSVGNFLMCHLPTPELKTTPEIKTNPHLKEDVTVAEETPGVTPGAGSGAGARDVVAGCRAEGLFIRDVSNMGRSLGRGTLRLAVKDGLTNRRMVEILERVMERLGFCLTK